MTSVFSTKFYQVHKMDEFIQEDEILLSPQNRRIRVRQGLNNKILVDGPSQEGENIKSNKWTTY